MIPDTCLWSKECPLLGRFPRPHPPFRVEKKNMSDPRIRPAMEGDGLDQLVGIVTGLLDYSWQLGKHGDWAAAWDSAQKSAGPSRHNKLLTRMAREMREIEREAEWFPPPSRVPVSIHHRHVLKVIRFWLMEGVGAECFRGFMGIGLLDVEDRWPEELRSACEAWGSERVSAANYIDLLAASKSRSHAIHSEWPLPEEWMPDDLAAIAQAVVFAVYLGIDACTSRFTARTSDGSRPDASVLSPVRRSLIENWPEDRLVGDLAAVGVLVTVIGKPSTP